MATNVTTLVKTGSAGGSMRLFRNLLQANFLMFVREKASLFWVILFPIALMLLFGSIWGNMKLNPADPNSTLTFISYLAPGLIVLSLMSNGLIGNAETMATYRERGILRRIHTTPMPLWQWLLAHIVVGAIVMVGQSFLMIITSMLVFNARYDTWGLLAAIPSVVLGAVMFMAMGQAVAAMVSKAKTVAVAAQVINVPLMFLGGLWTPIEMLPDWLQAISKYLPSAMMADLVRAPMLATFNIETNLPVMVSLIGVIIYFAVSVALAVRFFKWS
jgi:ABC-2 type transport system permease protein